MWIKLSQPLKIILTTMYWYFIQYIYIYIHELLYCITLQKRYCDAYLETSLQLLFEHSLSCWRSWGCSAYSNHSIIMNKDCT